MLKFKNWYFHYGLWRFSQSAAIKKLSSGFWGCWTLLRYKTREVRGKCGVNPVYSHPFEFKSVPIIVINLPERKDRWRQVVVEMRRLGAHSRVVRFDAIKHDRGMIGCSLSHALALSDHKLGPIFTEGGGTLICEDDIEFIAPRNKIEEVVSEFLSNPWLDVLLLSYNSSSTPRHLTDNLSITHDSGTTSCYLVKHHARETLVAAFEKSGRLLASGYPDSLAAPDQTWKTLQKTKLCFAVATPRLAKQRASFSDIEGRFTDYGV